MGTSQKSFDQVKSILGKLDRSIDQLRERRTGAGLARVAAPAAAAPFQAFSKFASGIGPDTLIGQGSVPATAPALPAVAPVQAPSPGASKWGRAQPVRRDDQHS